MAESMAAGVKIKVRAQMLGEGSSLLAGERFKLLREYAFMVAETTTLRP